MTERDITQLTVYDRIISHIKRGTPLPYLQVEDAGEAQRALRATMTPATQQPKKPGDVRKALRWESVGLQVDALMQPDRDGRILPGRNEGRARSQPGRRHKMP